MKKILRSKAVVFIAIYLIRLYVLLIFTFCKIEVRFNPKAERLIRQKHKCLLCFWHGRIFPFPRFMANYGEVAAVVSSHGDGEYLSLLLKAYGHIPVRGSSRKNSVQALMGVIKMLNQGTSVVITPDGPKGPRFQIKGAIGALAARYSLPVIPMTYAASKAKVLKSWDKFILPFPFLSRIVIEVGEPLFIPKVVPSCNRVIQEVMLEQTKKLDRELNLYLDY